jgi:hypothetical protein
MSERKVKCYPEDDFLDNKDCPNEGIVGPDESIIDSSKTNDSCQTDVRGRGCYVDEDPCYPWELTDFEGESCVVEDYIDESITIGGAVVNIHKMLGIYEQKKLVDEAGMGEPISGGSHPNNTEENAFDYLDTEWRSEQRGKDVVRKAFIGYDFGPIRLENDRLRYGIETYVKKNISTLKIKQGCDSKNRATKIRVERSEDGKKWYGVTVLSIPDCEGTVQVRFRSTAPSRYWRVRPLVFNGGDEDHWSVRALVLSEFEATNVENIQDKIFLENRDRKYNKSPIRTKATYTPVDYQGFLAKMGFNSPFNTEQFLFEFSFQQIVRMIGRPLVIGDIIHLPSETFFTPRMEESLKYLEITNVAWASTGFTPHWVPTLLRVVAEPAMASQETQDIFGKLTEDFDELGTSDTNDGMRNKKYQDIHDIDDSVRAEANTAVPQKGADYADKAKLSEELKDWVEGDLDERLVRKLDRVRHKWGVDGLPPNGKEYTEGDEFPDKPKDGDYHRLTYNKYDRNLPPRLYRFSKAKKRWLYLETDERYVWKDTKPVLDDFISPETEDKDTRTDINRITEKINKSKKKKD